MTVSELVVSVGDGGIGQRIDKFLSVAVPTISRTRMKKSFDENFVICDGKAVPAKHVLRGGEEIRFCPIIAENMALRPSVMPLDILFEDRDIIVVNKAPGIVVHPGNGTSFPTFVEGILSHCPLSTAGGDLRPGVVHRLDKDTSGVMVFAKTDTAHLRLMKMFAARTVAKTYEAIVCGTFTKNFGEIRLPIERNKHVRTKMSVSTDGREAITRWSVVKNFGQQFTHLRVNILTGRTHQIRVHMAHTRHPIVGDVAYGYDRNAHRQIVPNRAMLHSHGLTFKHPCSGKNIAVTASLPDDFVEILNSLEKIFSAGIDA
ncbi:MAG: RluA family pseudouridine synthase [Puniceicoccales bacterium]|jgi:23S rRNA pseudouridine1911/1915/1917 synthase|nr:RluA family pseudouridine synthase [Puniceicoccales bacterium]